MLILFDIDMTLIETDHAGIDCLLDTGRELFGQRFTTDGVPFGGRLDPLIIRDMLIASGIEPTPGHAAAVRAGYAERLEAALSTSGRSKALPGAHDLVRAVESLGDGATTGLLTGNFEETGRIKLGAAGFDTDRFSVRVWGDDSPHNPPARSHLPPVGMRRWGEMIGLEPDPGRVVIIGDTVHDVSCALENGCRVLGVATGHASSQELEDAGAHRVVSDLTHTQDIISWLTTTTTSRPASV